MPSSLAARSVSTAVAFAVSVMDPHRDGPPAIALAAGQLATAARRLPPVVRHAAQELAHHATSVPTATQQAVLDARRHVGAARAELRQALTDRTNTQPLVLGAELPPHPRMSARHPTGRQR